MILVIHLLVFLTDVLAYTLIHMRQLITLQLVIRVLILMTLVCSIAHTYHSQWFVRLEKIPSSLRSASRLVTEWLQTHLSDKLQLTGLLRLRLTNTTESSA